MERTAPCCLYFGSSGLDGRWGCFISGTSFSLGLGSRSGCAGLGALGRQLQRLLIISRINIFKFRYHQVPERKKRYGRVQPASDCLGIVGEKYTPEATYALLIKVGMSDTSVVQPLLVTLPLSQIHSPTSVWGINEVVFWGNFEGCWWAAGCGAVSPTGALASLISFLRRLHNGFFVTAPPPFKSLQLATPKSDQLSFLLWAGPRDSLWRGPEAPAAWTRDVGLCWSLASGPFTSFAWGSQKSSKKLWRLRVAAPYYSRVGCPKMLFHQWQGLKKQKDPKIATLEGQELWLLLLLPLHLLPAEGSSSRPEVTGYQQYVGVDAHRPAAFTPSVPFENKEARLISLREPSVLRLHRTGVLAKSPACSGEHVVGIMDLWGLSLLPFFRN